MFHLIQSQLMVKRQEAQQNSRWKHLNQKSGIFLPEVVNVFSVRQDEMHGHLTHASQYFRPQARSSRRGHLLSPAAALSEPRRGAALSWWAGQPPQTASLPPEAAPRTISAVSACTACHCYQHVGGIPSIHCSSLDIWKALTVALL